MQGLYDLDLVCHAFRVDDKRKNQATLDSLLARDFRVFYMNVIGSDSADDLRHPFGEIHDASTGKRLHSLRMTSVSDIGF